MALFELKKSVIKKGEEEIAAKIRQRRRQLLVHSCIYYALNDSIIDDATFDRWAKELVKLQKENPGIAKKVEYHAAFKDYTGFSGYDLPYRDDDILGKAIQLLDINRKQKNEQI